MIKKLHKPAFRIPLKHEEMSSIGGFILLWNQAEALTELLLAKMLLIDIPAAEKILASPASAPKTEIIKAVASVKVQDANLKKQIIDCANKLLGMSDFRNEVAHGRWATDITSGETSSRKRWTASKSITIEKIAENSNELCDITNQLADAHWVLTGGALPSPWRDRF